MEISSVQDQLYHGMALYRQGQVHDALYAYYLALANEPKSPLGHYLCGLAYRAIGLEKEASREWKTVIDLTRLENTDLGHEAQWASHMSQQLLTHQYIGRGA